MADPGRGGRIRMVGSLQDPERRKETARAMKEGGDHVPPEAK
jgi:hypothetical protein